jgi:hypothetical protein
MTSPISYVGTGGLAFGVNQSVNPSFPPGLLSRDLMVLFAAIRNSGTGTVNTPAGWTSVVASGNVGVFDRRYTDSDSAPTVNFSNGVAGADTMSFICVWRNAQLTPPVAPAAQLNASAQDINYPAATVPVDNALVLVVGWKQDNAIFINPPAGMEQAMNASVVDGDDMLLVVNYVVQSSASNISAGTLIVPDGVPAISRGLVIVFEADPYVPPVLRKVPRSTRIRR